MQIPIFQVDAFASSLFRGNPAAVCPLSEWLPDATMQAIAAENNLAETAFLVRRDTCFELRWFTPAVEVDLCGHATLASAHVLFHELKEPGALLRFNTKSGELTVERRGELLALDFPSRPPLPTVVHPDLVSALGGMPIEILAARDYLVRYSSESEVAALKPDMARLSMVDKFAVIVTAPGDNSDFVCRFFAPSKGIPEDPVTGSAHTTLIPYWAAQLGKNRLFSRQISQRVGELYCELRGDRVDIAGRSVLYLRGEIAV